MMFLQKSFVSIFAGLLWLVYFLLGVVISSDPLHATQRGFDLDRRGCSAGCMTHLYNRLSKKNFSVKLLSHNRLTISQFPNNGILGDSQIVDTFPILVNSPTLFLYPSQPHAKRPSIVKFTRSTYCTKELSGSEYLSSNAYL